MHRSGWWWLRRRVLDRVAWGAALAFVPKGSGRAVLEAVYWPEMARRTNDLRDAVLELVIPELRRQAYRLDAANLDLQLANAAVIWTRSNPTDLQRRAIFKAQMRLDSLRIQMWPRNTLQHIPKITWAIVFRTVRRSEVR